MKPKKLHKSCEEMKKVSEILKQKKNIDETVKLLDKHIKGLKKKVGNKKDINEKTMLMYSHTSKWFLDNGEKCKSKIGYGGGLKDKCGLGKSLNSSNMKKIFIKKSNSVPAYLNKGTKKELEQYRKNLNIPRYTVGPSSSYLSSGGGFNFLKKKKNIPEFLKPASTKELLEYKKKIGKSPKIKPIHLSDSYTGYPRVTKESLTRGGGFNVLDKIKGKHSTSIKSLSQIPDIIFTTSSNNSLSRVPKFLQPASKKELLEYKKNNTPETWKNIKESKTSKHNSRSFFSSR